MKIIELRAENVKRLRAVDITPDGTLQIVGGRNAQGKSSVLDAIWLALGGGKAAKDTTRPIRDGEDRASVTVDLGDLKVTRSWTQKGTSLRVESADGAQYRSPQAMLDGLVGRLSFDPLEFTRLTAREQRDALLDLVDLDVDMDQFDAQRALLFDQRTEIGRQGKAIGDVTVDDTLPAEETSAGDLIARIREAQDMARERAEAERASTAAHDAVVAFDDEWSRIEDEHHARRRVLVQADLDAAQRIDDLPKDIPDAAPLEAQLATVEETNAAIRANNQARIKAHSRDDLRRAYIEIGEEIAQLDEVKAQALSAAHFPVDGLGFDESGVTYGGVPFSQASSAEQIRVSIAMAMALNPRLRVLRIKDGSLLDEDTLETIRQQVADEGFQLWLERVGNADEGAVVIEDGEVAADD